MSIKVVLSVQGVDLNDDQTLVTLAEHLDDLGWGSVDGQVTATVYIDDADTVAAVIQSADAIRTCFPNAAVTRVDDQLVAISDIADRLQVSREAVRLWVTGQRRKVDPPFPASRGTVSHGRNPMKVWAWPDVLDWLRAQYHLDPEPGVHYAPGRDIAEINVALCDRSGGHATASLSRARNDGLGAEEGAGSAGGQVPVTT